MRLSLFLSLCVALAATATFAAQAQNKGKAPPKRQALEQPGDEDAAPQKSPGAKATSQKPADDAQTENGERDDADGDDADRPGAKKPAGLKLSDADEAKIEKNFSYIQGYYLGRNLREAGMSFDHKAFDQALNDAMEEKEPDMSPEDMQAAMQAVQKRIEQKMASRMAEAARKNKKEEETFLAANKKKEGVKALPSGLQYKVLKSGNGKSPKANDTVKVDYEGTLLDGTKFDSSYDRGEPIVMRVDQFIPGWKQALPLMKTGDKWQLFIPSLLAYGQQGNQVIPPNSMLLFELELLEVNPKAAAAKPQRTIKP
ncbi:MAG TPA: FKBP-type peptidyl-prolyl cis-trans isomerase [Pirellulales bacterium]